MKDAVILVEKIFVVFALLAFTGAFIPLFYEIITGGSAADANQGILAIQIPFYIIYCLTFFLIIIRWKKVIYVVKKGKLLLLLVAIAMISILWSYDPSITLRRSVALLGTTSFGVYFATRYGLKEQLQLLAWALGIATISSLLFTLAFPSYGIMRGILKGAWQGIYLHKNVLGRIMLMSAVVFLLTAINSRKHRSLMWTIFSIAVSLLVLSTSKTSLVLLLTLVILLPLYRALRWNSSLMLLFFIAAIIMAGGIGSLLLSNWETFLVALGRDATLTGRTSLWAAVLEKIWERPWFGYGYSAFWLGIEGPSAYVWLVTKWQVPYSHNGVLDLWLDLGLLGIFVYALGFLIYASRAITWVRRTTTSHGFWPAIFLTFTFLVNMTTESTVLKQNDFFWVLYVTVTLTMPVHYVKEG